MKIDYEYIKTIVSSMVDSDQMFIWSSELRDFTEDCDNNEASEKFFMHLELMFDYGLLGTGKKDGNIGIYINADESISYSSIPLRLTGYGYEYYQIASEPEIWNKLKDGLKNNTLDTLVGVGKDLLKTYAKKKLGLN